MISRSTLSSAAETSGSRDPARATRRTSTPTAPTASSSTTSGTIGNGAGSTGLPVSRPAPRLSTETVESLSTMTARWLARSRPKKVRAPPVPPLCQVTAGCPGLAVVIQK